MMPISFDAAYNNLKKKSFDLAIRISEIESSLGAGNSKAIKLKKSFSKLQSAVNFALYYRNSNMMSEANTHMNYAQKMADYLYSAVESVELPTAKVELENFEVSKEKPKKKGAGINLSRRGLKIRMSRKSLLILIALGVIYVFIMWWFFIRGRI